MKGTIQMYADPLDPRARAARRKHYQANKDQYMIRNRQAEARHREFVQNAKKVPCADCGIQYPPYVMQFDHLPGSEKLFNVSQMMKQSLAQIKTEIAKCDVVCANCHAERTYQRR